MKDKKEALKNEMGNIKKELKNRTFSYIAASLGVVAGFAWNEAIKSLIEYLFPLSAQTIMMKFFYAIAVTFAVIIIIVVLNKILKNDE